MDHSFDKRGRCFNCGLHYVGAPAVCGDKFTVIVFASDDSYWLEGLFATKAEAQQFANDEVSSEYRIVLASDEDVARLEVLA